MPRLQSSIETRLSLCRLRGQHSHCHPALLAVLCIVQCTLFRPLHDPVRDSYTLYRSCRRFQHSGRVGVKAKTRDRDKSWPQRHSMPQHSDCLIEEENSTLKACVWKKSTALESVCWCSHLAAANRGGRASS